MNGSEKSPEPQCEHLIVEYQAAQNSAQHHDVLVWSVTSVVWAANLVLLGFVVNHFGKDNPLPKVFLGWIIGLGIFLDLMGWIIARQLRAVKNFKYERCKVIEARFGLKQHTDLKKWLKEHTWLTSLKQNYMYSIMMLAFIAAWVIVFWMLWPKAS